MEQAGENEQPSLVFTPDPANVQAAMISLRPTSGYSTMTRKSSRLNC